MSDRYKEHLFSYRHEGSSWGFSLMARDKDDAQRRLRSIRANGTYDGELFLTIPVPRAKWLQRLIESVFGIAVKHKDQA